MERCKKCGEEKKEFRCSYIDYKVYCVDCVEKDSDMFRKSLVWWKGWYRSGQPTSSHAFYQDDVSLCGRFRTDDKKWTRTEKCHLDQCQQCERIILKRTHNRRRYHEYK